MTPLRLCIRNSCHLSIKDRPWNRCRRPMLEELTYILTQTPRTSRNKSKLKPWQSPCCDKLKITSYFLMNSSTSFLLPSNSKFCINKRSWIKLIATIRAIHLRNEEEMPQLLLEGPQMSLIIWLQATKGCWVFTSNRRPSRTQSLGSLQAALTWDITKSPWVNLCNQLILSWCNRIKLQLTRRKTCNLEGNRS